MKAFQEAKCLPGCNMSNDDNCLFVQGLPSDCDTLQLFQLFAPFGAIPQKGVQAMTNPDGSCKGFGFVNFIDASAMHAAVGLLNGAQLPNGSTLEVQPKTAKGSGKK